MLFVVGEFAEEPQPENPSEHTKSASTKACFMITFLNLELFLRRVAEYCTATQSCQLEYRSEPSKS